MDVRAFDIVVSLVGLLCKHSVFCQRWHRSADPFPAKLKLLHPAAGLHHLSASTYAAARAARGSPTVSCHMTVCCSLLQTGTAFTHRCLLCLCQRWREETVAHCILIVEARADSCTHCDQ